MICESCNRGWHQLCSTPHIPHEIVDSTLPWFCASCDVKLAASKQPQDVTDEASPSGPWTTGKGADKGEGLEAEKEFEYTEEIKREWLATQPLTVLIGYILSIEKSTSLPRCSPSECPLCSDPASNAIEYAPAHASETSSSTSLPIWPAELPEKLRQQKETAAREAAEREAALERQAEELAAAQGSVSMVGTPVGSETGTPLTFDGITIPGEAPARTAASRAAHPGQPQQGQQQAQPTPPPPPSFAPQQPVRSASQGGPSGQQHIPAFLRQPFNAVPALGGSSASPVGSPVSSFSTGPTGAASSLGDIPVGAGAQAQAQAQAARYAPYGSPSMGQQAQAQQAQQHPQHPQAQPYGAQMGQMQAHQAHPSQMQPQSYNAYAAPGQYANAYAMPGFDPLGSMQRSYSGGGGGGGGSQGPQQ